MVLFSAETIGAVRELSKVIDNLRHRIDELETHTVQVSHLETIKSNKSMSSNPSEYKLSPQEGSIFGKRGIQGVNMVLMFIITITVCLLTMAILFVLH